MNYVFKSKSFTITEQQLQQAGYCMLWAIKNIRELAGLPLDRYEHKGPLQPADFAQIGIFEAAKHMGIDFGAERVEQLDVRDAG